MLIRAYAVDGFPRAAFPALSEYVVRANYGMNLVGAAPGLRRSRCPPAPASATLAAPPPTQGHFDIDTSDYSVAFNANIRFLEVEPRDAIIRRIK